MTEQNSEGRKISFKAVSTPDLKPDMSNLDQVTFPKLLAAIRGENGQDVVQRTLEEMQAIAAQRELREETGYASNEITLLQTLTNLPTKVVGSLHVYLAKDVAKIHDTSFDENEEIEVLVKPYKEVIKMITNGEIIVSGTIASAFLACKKLNWEI